MKEKMESKIISNKLLLLLYLSNNLMQILLNYY